MTYEEILGECSNGGIEYKTTDVVVEIMEIIDYIKQRGISDLDDGEVSRAIGKLSIYMINLGQLKDDASMQEEVSNVYCKMKAVADYKEIRPDCATIKEAEMRVEEGLASAYVQRLTNKYRADSIETLYRNVERIITVLQTRTKVLLSDRANSSVSSVYQA